MSSMRNSNIDASATREEEASHQPCCTNANNKRRRQLQASLLPDDDDLHTKKRAHLDKAREDPFPPAMTPSVQTAQLLLRASQTDPCASFLSNNQWLQVEEEQYCQRQLEHAVIRRLTAAAQLPNTLPSANVIDFLPSSINSTLLPGSYQRSNISNLGPVPEMFDSFFFRNRSSNSALPRACLPAYESESHSFQHSAASLSSNSAHLLVQQYVESILASANSIPHITPMIPAISPACFEFDRLRLLQSPLITNLMQPSHHLHQEPVERNLLDMARFEKITPTAAVPMGTRTQSMSRMLLDDGQQQHCGKSLESDPYRSSISDSSTPSVNDEKRVRRSKKESHPTVIGAAGLLLASSDDRGMLNEHLCFLRQQIVYFQATMNDILSHTRGRNKNIALGQVGIRCKHCSHVPAGGRGKGSTYFPSNLMGIYQAAQNIHVEHLQSGLCPKMPPEVKKRFVKRNDGSPKSKLVASCTGKAYWADSAMKLGMIDAEDGIRLSDKSS